MPGLLVNGKEHTVDADPNMPLLWVLRDLLGLTGAKYGCGIGQCGACTIHLGGQAVRACKVTLGEAGSREVTTIEGLNENHAVIRAWAETNVPACGFCQPGQIMQTVALLRQKPQPEEEDVAQALSGNICRCGTYPRILAAIRSITGNAR
jgi:isoquinoline 1-oxidoreductase alpha subunit